MLFSPRAVGSQQKQQNEIHSAEDRRWRDKGKISDVLQCAKCRHKRVEPVRPMLVKFPHNCLFGICKASALLHPAKTAERKFPGA